MTITPFQAQRLRFALEDTRNLPSAYPILAVAGVLERTENGFKSIDPETAQKRIRELLTLRVAEGVTPAGDKAFNVSF